MEFGNAIQVSKSFLDADPNNISHVKRELQYGFDRAKAQYFPDWDGEYEFKDFGVHAEYVIARKDGGEVPEELIFKYTEWDLSEGSEEWPFGDEYCTETYYYYRFGWYADVPNEYYKPSKVAQEVVK